jgi:hypothetical protein
MSSLFHTILSQLQEKISKENSQSETIATIISGIIHTTITADQITVKDTTLRIKAAPTLKMMFKLQQQKILQALQTEGFTITTIQ